MNRRAGGACRADDQCIGPGPAPCSAVAEGARRVRQCGREPICKAATDGGRIVPPPRTTAVGFPGRADRGRPTGQPAAILDRGGRPQCARKSVVQSTRQEEIAWQRNRRPSSSACC